MTKGIKTFLRFRPSLPDEDDKLPDARPFDKLFDIRPNMKSVSAAGRSSKKTFLYDRVFLPHTTQSDVYLSIGKPLVTHVLSGFNASLLAYGTSGSGKTYSILGPRWHAPKPKSRRKQRNRFGQGISPVTWQYFPSRPSTASSVDSELSDDEQEETTEASYLNSDLSDGIVPRIVNDLFREANKTQKATISISVSFVEVYRKKVYDLLNGCTRVHINDAKKGFVSMGSASIHCRDALTVMKTIKRGIRDRMVGKTNTNEESSRSHAVIVLTVKKEVGGEMSYSQLCLCDLAGSERVSKTGTAGLRLHEAKSINTSLLALRQVIFALARQSQMHSQSSKDPFIPYRNSQLTRLLRNSLGGNAITSLLCTSSSHEWDYWESMATMEFSQAAAAVRNRPRINKVYTSAQLMKMLREERSRRLQISMRASKLEEEVAFYRIIFDKFHQDQQEKRMEATAGISLHSILPFFLCPLTGHILRNPVIAADGHTYEKKDIQKHMVNFNFSPVTGKEFSHRKLIPNLAVEQQLNFFNEMYGSLMSRIRNSRDLTNPLPDEIICHFTLFLPMSDLFSMAQVNKRWWMLISSEYLLDSLRTRSDFLGSDHVWEGEEMTSKHVWEMIVEKKRKTTCKEEKPRVRLPLL